MTERRMAPSRFCRYELRTTDPNAARAFYVEIFGTQFWDAELALAPLPEPARARGAPAHWLGQIGVSDLGELSARFTALGARHLGPLDASAGRSSRAIFQDPFGAILALIPEPPACHRASVAWHLLLAEDHARAFALYADSFGWISKELFDLGPERGCHQTFAWDDSGRSVGSVANLVRLPETHPQWLFFFPVPDLDASIARVRALGGLALEPVRTANGDRVAACDDPEGAAFGLYQALPEPAPG